MFKKTRVRQILELPYSAVRFETMLGKQGQAVTTGKGDKGIILIYRKLCKLGEIVKNRWKSWKISGIKE